MLIVYIEEFPPSRVGNKTIAFPRRKDFMEYWMYIPGKYVVETPAISIRAFLWRMQIWLPKRTCKTNEPPYVAVNVIMVLQDMRFLLWSVYIKCMPVYNYFCDFNRVPEMKHVTCR